VGDELFHAGGRVVGRVEANSLFRKFTNAPKKDWTLEGQWLRGLTASHIQYQPSPDTHYMSFTPRNVPSVSFPIPFWWKSTSLATFLQLHLHSVQCHFPSAHKGTCGSLYTAETCNTACNLKQTNREALSVLLCGRHIILMQEKKSTSTDFLWRTQWRVLNGHSQTSRAMQRSCGTHSPRCNVCETESNGDTFCTAKSQWPCPKRLVYLYKTTKFSQMFPLIQKETEHMRIGDEIDNQPRTWHKWQTIFPATCSS
jgi:hypothetical protein